MTIKTRLAKLENQTNPNYQPMPEGLSPMEQYLFLINNTGKIPVKVSATDAYTPEQAYSALIVGGV